MQPISLWMFRILYTVWLCAYLFIFLVRINLNKYFGGASFEIREVLTWNYRFDEKFPNQFILLFIFAMIHTMLWFLLLCFFFALILFISSFFPFISLSLYQTLSISHTLYTKLSPFHSLSTKLYLYPFNTFSLTHPIIIPYLKLQNLFQLH